MVAKRAETARRTIQRSAAPGPPGLPTGQLGGPDFYTRGGLCGTSFAAPTVAGGAALLYDAAYSVFSSE